MKDTRQNIIEAAILVFNDDPSAPLEKVAEKGGITRRTLHRYFRDRNDLISTCESEMQLSCNKAMNLALDSSDDPLVQLERMLYAGIDCGAKYSFFTKLHRSENHHHSRHNPDCVRYDATWNRYYQMIAKLKENGKISSHITGEWVFMLFSGIIAATVNASGMGTEDAERVKKFAWFSFSRGIGI
jgi:AcrR family transcriptional regulator